MIRISSLPSFLACPSSALPCEHPYDPPAPMAALGTAAHLALARYVTGDVFDVDVIAAEYHVDRDELARLVRYGQQAWAELGLYGKQASAEQSLEGIGIKGTADVVYYHSVAPIVIDWKSNRIQRDYTAQLTGYAAACFDELALPPTAQVKTVIVWLRFGEFEVSTVRRAEVNRLYKDIERAKVEMGKRYAPGNTCSYCRRQLICQARHEYIRSATTALAPLAGVQLTPDAARYLLPQVYHKAKHLRKALAAYDEALKLVLVDGPLPDGQGGELELEVVTREKIKAREAWPHLIEAGLDDADLAECVSISKSAVMRAIGNRAGRGGKGRAQAQLMDELREAGAIETTAFQTVKTKKGN